MDMDAPEDMSKFLTGRLVKVPAITRVDILKAAKGGRPFFPFQMVIQALNELNDEKDAVLGVKLAGEASLCGADVKGGNEGKRGGIEAATEEEGEWRKKGKVEGGG